MSSLTDDTIIGVRNACWDEFGHMLPLDASMAFARAILALTDEKHRAEIADLKNRISFMGDELAIEVNWRNKACDASDDALMRLIAALAELDALRISDRIKTENCEALRADAFTAAIDAARSKA